MDVRIGTVRKIEGMDRRRRRCRRSKTAGMYAVSTGLPPPEGRRWLAESSGCIRHAPKGTLR
ncbi:MAG: hypothetical protein R3F11_10270 [Verrucomicrobiales bacterium]